MKDHAKAFYFLVEQWSQCFDGDVASGQSCTTCRYDHVNVAAFYQLPHCPANFSHIIPHNLAMQQMVASFFDTIGEGITGLIISRGAGIRDGDYGNSGGQELARGSCGGLHFTSAILLRKVCKSLHAKRLLCGLFNKVSG